MTSPTDPVAVQEFWESLGYRIYHDEWQMQLTNGKCEYLTKHQATILYNVVQQQFHAGQEDCRKAGRIDNHEAYKELERTHQYQMVAARIDTLEKLKEKISNEKVLSGWSVIGAELAKLIAESKSDGDKDDSNRS